MSKQVVGADGKIWQLEISRRGVRLRKPKWRKDLGKDVAQHMDIPFVDDIGAIVAAILFVLLLVVLVPVLFFAAELLIITLPLAVVAGLLSLLGRVTVAALSPGAPVISATRWGVRARDRAITAVKAQISSPSVGS